MVTTAILGLVVWGGLTAPLASGFGWGFGFDFGWPFTLMGLGIGVVGGIGGLGLRLIGKNSQPYQATIEGFPLDAPS